MDSTVVLDDVYSLCLEGDAWKPLLLIIPLRLGISDINPIYIPALKRCLELDSSCGMIGGRPNQALYFLGYVEDEVLYLDPHTTQRTGAVGQKLSPGEQEHDETYHHKHAARLSFSAMDPSLAVCFLCKTSDSFQQLLDKLRQEVLGMCTPALFEISQTRAVDWDTAEDIEWPTMPDIDWPAGASDSDSFAIVEESAREGDAAGSSKTSERAAV
ncbi:cysteine protease ATG4B isoform X2 [Drosophila subobscura]|nr:cysteine protease ATG4B isoform X2 [Drosophila subobscura]